MPIAVRARDRPRPGLSLLSARPHTKALGTRLSQTKNGNTVKIQILYYLCIAKFGTNQLKSLKTPSMFSKIYRYFSRFSTTVTGKAKGTTVSQHDFHARNLLSLVLNNMALKFSLNLVLKLVRYK